LLDSRFRGNERTCSVAVGSSRIEPIPGFGQALV
jgi:hypothetical protein